MFCFFFRFVLLILYFGGDRGRRGLRVYERFASAGDRDVDCDGVGGERGCLCVCVRVMGLFRAVCSRFSLVLGNKKQDDGDPICDIMRMMIVRKFWAKLE